MNHNDNALLKLYRVQGGIFPNRSKESIMVLPNHKINIGFDRCVYIGDMEHMLHFLKKRLNINDIKDLVDNVEKYDISVVEMIVPYWLPYLIEQYAVSQFEKVGKNVPRLVDKNMPRT